MLTILLVVFFSLMLATPSQAQIAKNSVSEQNSKIAISDSTAIQALEEAESSVEIYLRSNSLSGDTKKLVSGMEDAMSKMAIDFPQKAVVSDLSDQKRVSMPFQTVLKMIEANIKKFEVK